MHNIKCPARLGALGEWHPLSSAEADLRGDFRPPWGATFVDCPDRKGIAAVLAAYSVTLDVALATEEDGATHDVED